MNLVASVSNRALTIGSPRGNSCLVPPLFFSWLDCFRLIVGSLWPVAIWLKLPFRFKILHPAHKRVFRVVGLGRSGSFRVALGS